MPPSTDVPPWHAPLTCPTDTPPPALRNTAWRKRGTLAFGAKSLVVWFAVNRNLACSSEHIFYVTTKQVNHIKSNSSVKYLVCNATICGSTPGWQFEYDLMHWTWNLIEAVLIHFLWSSVISSGNHCNLWGRILLMCLFPQGVNLVHCILKHAHKLK